MNSDGVLITDGEIHSTEAVLRSLGKKGISVTVAAEHKNVSARYSKYCTNFLTYPSAKTEVERFVCALSKYVARKRFEVLFPMGDLTLWPIAVRGQEFEKYIKLPFTSCTSVEQTFNKVSTLSLAQKLGVPTPKSFCLENVSQLKSISKRVSYPAVIKSRCSWFWIDNKTTTQSNLRPEYVVSPSQLVSKYLEMHDKSPFPIVQEYIPGQNYSVALLCNNSHVKASCFIKVDRAIPVMGGNSTCRETVGSDSQMLNYACKLMTELDWHGIAEIEFRRDERDSTPKLMEINGRFWGSVQVAILAGIDFPYLLYKLVTEGKIPTINHYKIGVRNRWLSGDLRCLVDVLKGNYFANKFLPHSKLRVLRDFTKLNLDSYDDLFLEDILPFLMNLKRWRMFYKSCSRAREYIKSIRV